MISVSRWARAPIALALVVVAGLGGSVSSSPAALGSRDRSEHVDVLRGHRSCGSVREDRRG